MYIKHSKFKNTGILFELLVRKITADTLAGIDSPSVHILKKYFVNTELGKEYKLYETMFSDKNLSEGKASLTLSTILEQSKKLNRRKLKNEKYNLIKELKSHYDVEDLFKTKLSDYKAQASLYTLLEITKDFTIYNIKFSMCKELEESEQTKLFEDYKDILTISGSDKDNLKLFLEYNNHSDEVDEECEKDYRFF